MRCNTILYLLFTGAACYAQDTLSVKQCMRYAVEHNHEVRQHQFALDSYKAEKTAAIGAFMPAIEVSIGAQCNFGRAIDPETNTYTNVNTFYNSDGIYASMPIFDGMRRVHMLQAQKANVLRGENALQSERDRAALSVFQAYVDVLYYSGATRMAMAKRDESRMMLSMTKVKEEIGQRSVADVAMMEAQLAGDEFEVIRQGNLLEMARQTLRDEMNYDGELTVSENLDIDTIMYVGRQNVMNSQVAEAYNEMETSRYYYRSSKADFMPSLYVNAGVSTTYYRTIGMEAQPLDIQLRNNRGEYVSATLSIPIFDRLGAASNVRKARNQYHISRERYESSVKQYNQLRIQAELDVENYQQQSVQMEKKVASDSLAYTLTRRQYEEGLASPIDVQQASAMLLASKATLLQSRLMLALKSKLLRYYNGEPMIE